MNLKTKNEFVSSLLCNTYLNIDTFLQENWSASDSRISHPCCCCCCWLVQFGRASRKTVKRGDPPFWMGWARGCYKTNHIYWIFIGGSYGLAGLSHTCRVPRSASKSTGLCSGLPDPIHTREGNLDCPGDCYRRYPTDHECSCSLYKWIPRIGWGYAVYPWWVENTPLSSVWNQDFHPYWNDGLVSEREVVKSQLGIPFTRHTYQESSRIIRGYSDLVFLTVSSKCLDLNINIRSSIWWWWWSEKIIPVSVLHYCCCCCFSTTSFRSHVGHTENGAENV